MVITVIAAVYARVSSEDQAERGTIENQLEFARKYCDLHQLEIVDWYLDEGVTGTLPLEERPEGARLLSDAHSKRFELLLVYRIDRLGRSARVILNAVAALEGLGVQVRSMSEPFDTGNPSGRFLLTVLAGVADLERESILERMHHGANRAARAGKWLGGIVPYGYRVNDKGYLEISEAPLPGLEMSEADVVRLIYRMIADHESSCVRVADYLNALGVPPAYVVAGRQVARGKRKEATSGYWLPGRIRNMVVNTTYKGIHEYGKRTSKKRELIPREVPAIVSEETWLKAQEVLRQNQIEAMKNAKRRYLLRGLIKCGTCGRSYQGTSYPGPERRLKAYYVCGSKANYKGPSVTRCKSQNIPAEWIEHLVWSECVAFIESPGEAIKELAAALDEQKAETAGMETEAAMAKAAIDEKELERERILDLYRRKIISSQDVEKQMDAILREQEALRSRLRELEKLLKSTDATREFDTAEKLLESLRAKLHEHPDPAFETKREIVKTLVKSITVVTDPGGDGPKGRAVVTTEFSFAKGVTRMSAPAATTVQRTAIVCVLTDRSEHIGQCSQVPSWIAWI
jgi:site-specific DNA recombinase